MTGPALGTKKPSHFDESELTHAAWGVVGAIGLTLLIVGLVDLFLAWWPLRFGSPEWEFGTISATLNNLPVPAMGLALVLAHAVAHERRSQLAAVGVWSAAVVLFLGVCAVFYALDVPLALRAVQDPVMRRGLKAGVIKGVASLLMYGLFHLWCTVVAFRRFSKS